MSEYQKYIETVIGSPRSNRDSQRTARNTASSTKVSRSKDKLRLQYVKSKQTFLTDTQTSDYTKSSNQCRSSTNIQTLNQTIKNLKRQNHELKQQLVDLKSSCYFSINEDKLKELIVENDKIKTELLSVKKKLEDSIIERDFLQRFNKNLKTQCEQLTRQVLKLNKQYSPKIQLERSPRNTSKEINFQDPSTKKIQRLSVKYLQEMYQQKNASRSKDSEEKLASKPRQSTKSKQKDSEKMIKKSRSTSGLMDNQYFIGKGMKEEAKKYKRNRKQEEE